MVLFNPNTIVTNTNSSMRIHRYFLPLPVAQHPDIFPYILLLDPVHQICHLVKIATSGSFHD